MNVPADLKYTRSHEWVKLEADGSVTVGITDHAQEALGDIVFLDLPEAGRQLNAGEECAVVESVKAASDVYAPVSGEVIATNGDLAGDPAMVNRSAEGEGWLFRMTLSDPSELSGLMDHAAYKAMVG